MLLVSVSVFAQKKLKIKGDKNVIDTYKTLEDFNAIEIDGDFKVNITQTPTNGYHIKTDQNLIEVVKFDILNGVLKIYLTHRITSFRDLEIDVTFDNIEAIKLIDGAELTSGNKLIFEELTFEANDDSQYKLDLQVANGTFLLNRSTKGNLQLKGQTVQMILNENAFVKGGVVLENLDMEVNERADIDFDGDVAILKLTASGSSDVKAKKLRATYADLNLSNTSDTHVYASQELKLYATGKSFVYVYGNPNITVDGLNDKSQIIKK